MNEQNKTNKAQALLKKLGVAAAVAAPVAANAAIDVSAVTTTIGEGVVAAGVIGLAFLGFKAGIAIFRQLRSAA